MTGGLRAHVRSNVVGYVALFVALGGTGYAAVSAIPGPDGRIHGCYEANGGALRVVSAGVPCRRGERILVWNQRGITGRNGVTGRSGVTGKSGLNGAAVVARARLSGTAVQSAQFPAAAVNVPLAGGSWTQGATDTDLILGQITYDSPSPADCPAATGHGLYLTLFANGNAFAQIEMFGSFAAGTTRNIPADLGGVTGAQNVMPFLFEPGVSTPQTLTATIQDNCSGATRYTIHALSFDVVRLS